MAEEIREEVVTPAVEEKKDENVVSRLNEDESFGALSLNENHARHLVSKLRNISGKSMVFSFIPPHGRRLNHNQTILIPGDIRYIVRQRYFKNFLHALRQGWIEIQYVPADHFRDAATNLTKVLNLNNGSVQVVDPSWKP